jgi:hypothetical protein
MNLIFRKSIKMHENILDKQQITDKYKKIMRYVDLDLLIRSSYDTLDDFFIARNQSYKSKSVQEKLDDSRDQEELNDSCDQEELDDNKRTIYKKFLSYLKEYIKKYESICILNMKDNINCAYAYLSLLSSIPTFQGYSFTLEKVLIDICDDCYRYFVDCCKDDEEYSECKSSECDPLLIGFIKNFLEGVKIMQIKNIDKQKKIKILCDGNYFVLDQRILINETDDMRTDYEKLTDVWILE